MEVTLAIALIGILAMLAFSKLYSSGGVTIATQASAAADLVRRAQALALTHGKQTRVVNSGSATLQLQLCATGGSCTVDGSLSTEQSVVVLTADLPVNIRFNSLGQPVDSTGVVLTANTGFTLRVASVEPISSGINVGKSQTVNTSFRITVSALTGRVTFARI